MHVVNLSTRDTPFFIDADAVEFVSGYKGGCVSIHGNLHYPPIPLHEIVAIVQWNADPARVQLVDLESKKEALVINALLFTSTWRERRRTCVNVGQGTAYTDVSPDEVARRVIAATAGVS